MDRLRWRRPVKLFLDIVVDSASLYKLFERSGPKMTPMGAFPIENGSTSTLQTS